MFSVAINVVGPPPALIGRHSHFPLLGVVALVAAIAASLTRVVLAFNGFGFWSLTVVGVLQVSIHSLLLIWLMPSRLRFSMRILHLILPLIGIGSRVSLARVLRYAAVNLDTALVGKLLGTARIRSKCVG